MPKPKRKFDKIAFVASDMPEAVAARKRLIARYGEVDAADADAIVALGGDGHMLQTLHRFMNDGIPIYGMNRGSVGFLMNDYSEEDLPARLAAAEVSRINPLSMLAYDHAGKAHKALAINEVSLVPRAPPGRQAEDPRRRQGAHGGARLRRRARRHAGRLDRLQSLRAWADTPHQCAAAGADAHQSLPARGAGAARCCPTRCASRSMCWSPRSAP